ncbi:MAG: hypothetical protein J6X91_05640 [Bacteroidales bacterium]|nr:hypothetical protein [Bacteroidales bacterium]
MKTNTIFTALVAILATVLTVSVSSTASAQSSSRRNTSGGSTATTQRSSDTRQKEAQVSQPRANNSGSVQNRNTSSSNRNATVNRNTSSDRQSTQSRGNSNSSVDRGRNNSNVGNVTSRPDNKPNNGNVTNRPDNKTNRPNNGNITNRPDNKPHNNGNVNRPNNNGPRATYYAGRGGDAATKLPPAPKFDRNNHNRHVNYNPFRDNRVYHRPAPIHVNYDFGYRFTTRPRHYYRVRINGMSMYFWDGIWYWHAYGYYNVHRPPVGTRIPISYIETSLYPVDFEYYSQSYGRDYYVDSYANFYERINSYELRVVDAPDGAILYDMPSDYEEIVHNGRVYYVVGNSIFEYVYSSYNSWYFRAVGIYYR